MWRDFKLKCEYQSRFIADNYFRFDGMPLIFSILPQDERFNFSNVTRFLNDKGNSSVPLKSKRTSLIFSMVPNISGNLVSLEHP